MSSNNLNVTFEESVKYTKRIMYSECMYTDMPRKIMQFHLNPDFKVTTLYSLIAIMWLLV